MQEWTYMESDMMAIFFVDFGLEMCLDLFEVELMERNVGFHGVGENLCRQQELSGISIPQQRVLLDCLFPNVMASKNFTSPHLLIVAATTSHSWCGLRCVTVRNWPNPRGVTRMGSMMGEMGL
jgi:hypothetical protein